MNKNGKDGVLALNKRARRIDELYFENKVFR